MAKPAHKFGNRGQKQSGVSEYTGQEERNVRDRHGGNIYDHKDVIDFSSNINPYPVLEPIRQAGYAALERIDRYPDPECRRLREMIVKKGEAFGQSFDEREVICGNGAAELIYAVCAAKMPKEALLVTPCFSEYELALSSTGARIRYYETGEEKGFRVSEDILEAIDEKLELMFLTVPNNPTGTLIPEKLLKRILIRCAECQVFCVMDESFLEFTKEASTAGWALSDKKIQQITGYLRSFTKLYAMAGIRLGYLLTKNEPLRERIGQQRQPWGVSLIAQEMGIAAISADPADAYARTIQKKMQKERQFLKEQLEPLVLTVFPSEANFLLLRAEEDFAQKLLKQGILIRDCSNFHGLQKGYFRIAVRTPQENERLVQAVRTIRGKERRIFQIEKC